MKNLLKNAKYFLVALLVAFSYSCSPEDGNNGAPGAQGEQGPAGEDGNANVIYSDWFEPVESDYSVNNSDYKSLPMDLQEYDSSRDALLVYYYDQNENNASYSYVYMLPFYRHSTIDGSLNKSILIDIRPPFSRVYVKIRSYSGNLLPREYLWEPDPSNLENKGVRFRYMIIPGNIDETGFPDGKLSKSLSDKNSLKPFERIKNKLSSENVNINDYQAVCDYYGIAY